MPAVWNVPGSQMNDFTFRFWFTPADARNWGQVKVKMRLRWSWGEVGVKLRSS